MAMKNPPHPGGVVLRQCIEPSGLTITAAAAAMGVTRTTLGVSSMRSAGFLPKWPCGCLRRSAGAPKAG
jgi:hypothetical protein